MCNTHVKQYYNENYGVLVGSLDTISFLSFCPGQGNNRLERAQNFFAFSDSDAVNRGTELHWQYAEVLGVGHNGYSLYHSVASGDSIPIAERMLFETPYQMVSDFSPSPSFNYSDSSTTVNFTDLSSNSTTLHWDFGDGTTSTLQNPEHIYDRSGTYYVCLTASDDCLNNTYCDSIKVT